MDSFESWSATCRSETRLGADALPGDSGGASLTDGAASSSLCSASCRSRTGSREGRLDSVLQWAHQIVISKKLQGET